MKYQSRSPTTKRWQRIDFNFSPTSSCKPENGEMVMAARSDSQLSWGKIQKFSEGLYDSEVGVGMESGAKRLFFPASIGKILA